MKKRKNFLISLAALFLLITPLAVSCDELPFSNETHTCEWGEWSEIKAPSCEQKGEKQRICAFDSAHVEKQELPALSHAYENNVCSRCNTLKVNEGLKYDLLENGTYSVSIGTCTDTDIFIPAEYEGKPVSTLGSFSSKALTGISIPDSVISISTSYAFESCENLKYNEYDNAYYLGNDENPYLVLVKAKDTSISSCNVHNDTKIIHALAFSACNSLTSVTIGNAVKTIGEYAFSCENLIDVYITDVAAWCEISFTNATANPLHKGDNLYVNGELVTHLVIPNTVKYVASRAFYSCASITEVTIPDSVTSVGSWAFWNCYNLKEIVIPDSVAYLGQEAFEYCYALQSAVIGNSVTEIKNYTFYECKNLKNLTIGTKVEKIGKGAFYRCYNVTTVNIPNSVTEIGDYAFCACQSLSIHYLSGGLVSIGNSAFEGCDSLTGFIFTQSLTSIGSSAFAGSGLKSVTLSPNSRLTTIPDSAFARCYSLKSVTLSDSITEIVDNAFYDCYNLTTVTFGNALTSIGCEAFYNCNSLVTISLPDSILSVASRAFYWCNSLTDVTLGNSITFVGENAFCHLSDSNFNEYQNAYYLGNDENPYLVLIKAKNTSITACSVHSDTKVIAHSAFSGCTGLTSVTLPDSIGYINYYAFNYCTNLTTILFNGTTEQWEAVEKSKYWNYNVPATKSTCSNGDVLL